MSNQRLSRACETCQGSLALAGAISGLEGTSRKHLETCVHCRAFAGDVSALAGLALAEAEREPPFDLVDSTLARLRPLLAEREQSRRHEGRRVGVRLAFVGMLALPVILALNSAFGWLGHSLLAEWVSLPLADVFLFFLATTTLLGLSVTYGALPLVAEWTVTARQSLVPVTGMPLTPGHSVAGRQGRL